MVYKVFPSLQNASIVDPKPTVDDYGRTRYYLDPQHAIIALKADDGYSFENDGSLSYTKDALGNEADMPIKATHTNTLTITLPSDLDWSNQSSFTVTMEAVAKPVAPTPKQYKLIPNLQNATIIEPQPVVDSSGNHYYLDQQHTTITIKTNDGYTFENDGTLTYVKDILGHEGDVPIKATHTDTATVSLPSDIDWSNQDSFGLIMDAVAKPVAPTPKKYKIVPNLQNATIIDPKPVADSSGTHYYLDQQHPTITLKANDGYQFENDGTLTYVKNALYQECDIVVKATHTNIATVSLPSDIDWSVQDSFTIIMGAVTAKIVNNTGGFTNIYKADYPSLLKLSNELIVNIVGDPTTNIQVFDITPYINNIVILPFNVPSGEKSAIVAGNKTFDTQLPTVDNDYLTVDLGKIAVAEQYRNGYDYYEVKTRLILPYTNMLEIDPTHVINKTISIKYDINVINGDTTINLYDGYDLFFSQQVNLASEVPFISRDTKSSQYAVINQLKTMFRNDVQQAYIIIEQPTPVLNSDYYPTNEKGTLKGYTGNVKAKLLNNVDVNSNELNALQNLLASGVHIK